MPKNLPKISKYPLKQTKNNKKRQSNKPWFNWQTRLGKRELRKATTAASEHTTNSFIRENFYKVKGIYKKILSKTSNKFFEQLNSDIENGKVLNWQAFKKLKSHKTNKIQHDSYDMDKFETFFRELYSDTHKTLNKEQKDGYVELADSLNNASDHPLQLNTDITEAEVKNTITSLKTGKASSIDMISNEILKSLDTQHQVFLTKIFNVCFEKGVYPWNESVVTPLHKKGDKADPDNYRAVAVSSVIGKLFATILLDRLRNHRNSFCPDPPNQLGFTKNAQTYDHIITMQTIISKYKKLKKPVYAVFVDFKKAFDSVCRQALFYKLTKCGITGKFYNVLKNIYSNSCAFIKLSGYLSKKFGVSKGTEQGHPLSPDLFKIYLSDLSCLLEFDECPELSKKLITHLLWADDLILLSLNPETAQNQINVLGKFCTDWGIEVNEIKTKVVIFGKDKNSDYSNINFSLQGNSLEIVESYCYLGIILHETGELRTAQVNLKMKAMRAFCGLKRTIIRSKLSFKSLLILFDSLIKPITLYGAPIWAPTSTINKSIIKQLNTSNILFQKSVVLILRKFTFPT